MTILYTSDFKKYPSAIIDLNTKNTSWVEFAAKLKAMGVKNWGFHLTLLDPSLVGVDPHDPNLDNSTVLKIQTELANNYWYYTREVFRVPSNVGGETSYLRANRGNIATFWSVFNSFITYLEQIRQTGKSLTGRVIKTGVHTCWAKGAATILFTKSDLRADEIDHYKKIKAELPGYMWYKTPKDKDNQQDFTTLCHGNVTFTYIPSTDEISANRVGRGKTPIFILGDEIPFLPYVYVSIPAMIASTMDSFTQAEKVNSFHGILYSTTAGDLSTKEGVYVYEKIRQRGMFFSEILYDAVNKQEASEIIFANSNNKIVPNVVIAFNHNQLGYTDEWLTKQIAINPAAKDQIKRDYLGIWTFGSQYNPIPEHLLAIIRKYSNSNYKSQTFNSHYLVRFHEDIDYTRGRKIAMGLDMSEGIGRDAITGVGVDVETLETLIAFSVSESNLIYFGSFLAGFLKQFPNITLVPESKSAWVGGIRDQLLIEMPKLGLDPGKRIYSTIVDRAKGSETEQKEYRNYQAGYPSERKYYPYRQDMGFMTTRSSRETLYRDVMMNAVKETPNLIRDPQLIDELSTLVERKGRIDHASSGHDDHVVSFALAHWFIRYARNIEHYGIDSTKLMSKVDRELEEMSPEEWRKIEKYNKISKQLDVALEKLARSNSAIEIAYLEARVTMLEGDLPEMTDTRGTAGSLAARSKEAANTRNGNRNRTKGHTFSKPLF